MKTTMIILIWRDGNRVANTIAKETISFENNDLKLYSIPSWVNPYDNEDKQ